MPILRRAHSAYMVAASRLGRGRIAFGFRVSDMARPHRMGRVFRWFILLFPSDRDCLHSRLQDNAAEVCASEGNVYNSLFRASLSCNVGIQCRDVLCDTSNPD
jgi:hypothetical protein